MRAFKAFIGGVSILSAALLLAPAQSWAAGDLVSKAPDNDGIASTRHNLTQSWLGGTAVTMDSRRNDYGEVCVYCHTPHGANSENIAAPLWNRTFNNNTYTTYDTLNTITLTEAVTQPGVNSLTCLSCHDGTLGVDSIVNMPGRGGYGESNKTSQDNGFLSTWTNASGLPSSHVGLSGTPGSDTGCMACHSPTSGDPSATDFTVFNIGTDLTNDHPIGINAPTTRYGVDFNAPDGSVTGIEFYDGDGNSRPDKNEIRFYDTGDGPEVECASCHDPHGVAPTAGAKINVSFLRVSNDDSAVCQTCHDK